MVYLLYLEQLKDPTLPSHQTPISWQVLKTFPIFRPSFFNDIQLQSMKTLYGFILIFSLLAVACGGEQQDGSDKSAAPKKEEETAKAEGPNAEKIFRTYCITCHGIDGKLGLNGARDLSVSEVPIEERILQVTNGKGLMAPFEGILTEEQIKAVAEYTLTFKEQ